MQLDHRMHWWLPAMLVVQGILPLPSPTPYVAQTIMALNLLLIYVLSWNFYYAFIGETNFGHAFFIGGAGYLSAFLAASLHLPVWIAIACAVVTAGFSAAGIAWISDKAKGAAFALFTMALQLVLYQVAYLAPGVFGGEQGLIGVPRIADSLVSSYYLVWIALVLLVTAFAVVDRSRIGNLLRATGDDEALAQSCGIRTRRLKVALFAASGALGGLGGALYAHTTGQINAEMLSSGLSVTVVLLALAGGSGTGPALLTIVFFTARESISGYISAESLVYSCALFLAVLALPGGLVRRGGA